MKIKIVISKINHFNNNNFSNLSFFSNYSKNDIYIQKKNQWIFMQFFPDSRKYIKCSIDLNDGDRSKYRKYFYLQGSMTTELPYIVF